MLSAAGLAWYEISNWSRSGRECRHNQLYWSQGQYLGIGCAAHSHRVAATGAARRWWNVRTPERYAGLIAAGRSPEAAGEDIDPGTRRREALELALRTREGVPEGALPDWADDPVLSDLVEVGGGGSGGWGMPAGPLWGVPAGPRRLVLTRAGRLLANEVAIRLVV
jgi:oxygen-independent coproporphyrinogen-3 oxidase